MRRCLTLLPWFALAATALSCKEKVSYPDEDYWVEAVTCPPPGPAGQVFVTNSGDDTLSWIDVASLEVVCQEPVGRIPAEREGPHHGSALADGSAYFVGLSNYVPGSGMGPHGSHGSGDVRGYLLKYALPSHELVGQRLVDRSPGDVRLTPDERYVLQSHFDRKRVLDYLMPVGDAAAASPNSTLAVVDPLTMDDIAFVDLCPSAHGISVSADSATVYVTCYDSDELAIVTLEPPWDVQRFAVGPAPAPLGANRNYGPYAVSVEPGTSPTRVWVSNTDSTEVRIFEGTTMVGEAISTSPGAPFFGDFWQDYFVAPLQGNDALAFIHRETHAVEITPPLGGCTFPHAVLTLDDATLLVACEGNHQDPGSVVVVNTTTRVVDKALEVGVFPDDLVFVAP
jgi:YVTN family beta-propeller protein